MELTQVPVPTGEVHPIAALFPMMTEEELQDLAADIKANGLRQPITLDAAGMLIDGRNRLHACELAGVRPLFTVFDGDAVAFILSSNVARRHLSKGQQAMATAKAWSMSDHDDSRRAFERGSGVSHDRMARALDVLAYAPELADGVLAGTEFLDSAYEQVRDAKRARESEAERVRREVEALAGLRTSYPDLADLVDEERLARISRRQPVARRRLAPTSQRRWEGPT